VQAKEAALPEEPPMTAPDPLVTCALRFPDGSRLTRRFRTSDLLQSLFDFTDAKVQGPMRC
jgi:UBX domain